MAGLSCQSAQIIHKMNQPIYGKKKSTNQRFLRFIFASYANLAMKGEKTTFQVEQF